MYEDWKGFKLMRKKTSMHDDRRRGTIQFSQAILEDDFELSKQIFKEFDFIWETNHSLYMPNLRITGICKKFDPISDCKITPYYEVEINPITVYDPATGEDEIETYTFEFVRKKD